MARRAGTLELLKGINDEGQTFAQVWGERIARVLSWFVRLFGTAVTAGKNLIDVFKRLPNEVKAAMAAIGAIAIAALNPFLALIAAMTAALLLYDDYLTWRSGGEAYFSDVWAALNGEEVDMSKWDALSRALYFLVEHWKELVGAVGGVIAFVAATGAINALTGALSALSAAGAPFLAFLAAAGAAFGYLGGEVDKTLEKLNEIFALEGYEADTVNLELANLSPGVNRADYLIAQIEAMSQADDRMSRLRKGLYMNKLKDVLGHGGKRTMDLPEDFVSVFGDPGGPLSVRSLEEIMSGVKTLTSAFEQQKETPRLTPQRDPFTGEIYSARAESVNGEAAGSVTNNQSNSVNLTSNIQVQSTDPAAAAMHIKAEEEALLRRYSLGWAGKKLPVAR
jgi:hypothetical protein